MTSFRQIEANRRNACKSAGPITEEGKQRSCRRCGSTTVPATAFISSVEARRLLSWWPVGTSERKTVILRGRSNLRATFKRTGISKTKPKPKIKTIPWDSAAYLKSDEDIAHYLEAVFEDGNPNLVAAALGDVARAKGMSQIAQAVGLGRESLYKALSTEGNPEFATVAQAAPIDVDTAGWPRSA